MIKMTMFNQATRDPKVTGPKPAEHCTDGPKPG